MKRAECKGSFGTRVRRIESGTNWALGLFGVSPVWCHSPPCMVIFRSRATPHHRDNNKLVSHSVQLSWLAESRLDQSSLWAAKIDASARVPAPRDTQSLCLCVGVPLCRLHTLLATSYTVDKEKQTLEKTAGQPGSACRRHTRQLWHSR